jgi:glutathione peroxidase-family protein
MSESLFDSPLQEVDAPATLAEHRGDVLLVVNVASK